MSDMGFIHKVIEIRQNGENVHDLLYVKIRGMTEVFLFYFFINGAMRSRCCVRYVPNDDKETHCKLTFLAHIDYNDIMKTMKARERRNIKKTKVRLILLSIDTCSY